jgi:hypothetical protein
MYVGIADAHNSLAAQAFAIGDVPAPAKRDHFQLEKSAQASNKQTR